MKTLLASEIQAPTYIIDGSEIHNWSDMVASINAFIPDADWKGNSLDALDDISSGGYGTSDKFVVLWKASEVSRQVLDLESPHYFYDNKTLFETLVDIFEGHENIELRLE